MVYVSGALKDKTDKRDYLIRNFIKPVKLPVSLDLSYRNQPVRDQGAEGSCTAFAGCAMKESQEDNEGWLSTRFIYERVKQPGGGAYPRDILEVLLKTGVPPETCQLYIPNETTTQCPNALELAKQNKIKAYVRLLTIDEMKQCLYQYGCFLISFEIYERWLNPTNGIVTKEGNYLGGHALECCGFNDTKQLLKFKNSWGLNWGVLGYGYISYSDAMSSLYDAWKSLDIPELEEEKILPPEPKVPWYKRIWTWIKSLFQ